MPRDTAYRVLSRIEDGAYSHIVLGAELDASGLAGPNRGLATEIVYGVLTWRRAIDRLLAPLLDKGLNKTPPVIRDILRVGAYQLVWLDRIPDSAAVNTSVELAKRYHSTASGLVNGVLRKLASAQEYQWWDEEDRTRKPARYLGERYSTPTWMANLILQSSGGVDRAEPVMKAYSSRPALFFRRVSQAELPEGCAAHAVVPQAFSAPRLTQELRSGLELGDWVVQDLGAQLISHYCGFEGERVIDGCAGLGGKALFLAGRHTVDAVDPARPKLNMLRAAAKRHGLSARVTCHQKTLQDYQGLPASGVLLDAPCTAIGVIRRHPETRWSRSKNDVRTMAEIQSELLDRAMELTEPGGIVVYAVCTFTPNETAAQVSAFMSRHDVEELPAPKADFDWAPFLDKRGRLSLNPHDHDSDGFFAVRFRKLS